MKRISPLLSLVAFCLLSCGKKDNPATTTNTSSYAVSTIAGGSFDASYPDGTGANAGFYSPQGITIDAAGNLYVTDRFKIRKVTQAGVVSTFAGTNPPGGYADGARTSALFGNLQGIVMDAGGNMFVCDNGNLRIRKITPAGIVSTVAGNGGHGALDGPAVNAQFSFPQFIAIDASSGNLYVSDLVSIRKITPAGVVSTFSVGGYNCVATDILGNVYATRGNAVVKITPAGVASILAGDDYYYGSVDGTGTNARFFAPNYLIVDPSGNVYVSDFSNFRIRKITPAGVVTTFAGTGVAGYVDGSLLSAQFAGTVGLVMDAAGNIYIADGHRIRKIAKQ